MPYFAFFNSPFFTPASGKIHIATTMKTAVTMTKIEKSGRIGEPLHQARTAATIRTMTETAALTSLGMASLELVNVVQSCACGAFVHQFTGTRFQCEPTGTAAASSGRRGAPRRLRFRKRVS